jgi:hypothetical protein
MPIFVAIGQVIRIVNCKRAPPVSSVTSVGSAAFSSSVEIMIVDADRVDQHIGFLHHRLDFAFGVAAVIVAAIE